jgi:hypothetical protein
LISGFDRKSQTWTGNVGFGRGIGAQAEQEKKKKVGAPNLSVDKVSLQKLYSDLGGDDVKLLTGKTQVMELRQAIRNLPQYKAILKYSKA